MMRLDPAALPLAQGRLLTWGARQHQDPMSASVSPPSAYASDHFAPTGASKAPVQKPPVIKMPTVNQSSRGGARIDTIVLHQTEGPPGETARAVGRWFQNPANRASSHYIIGKDGEIVQPVEDHRKAWHAGKSFYDGRSDVSTFSLGIELVNLGNGRDPFTDAQYRSLAKLMLYLMETHGVPWERVVGHNEIAVPKGRKKDPSPNFSYERLKAEVEALRRGTGTSTPALPAPTPPAPIAPAPPAPIVPAPEAPGTPTMSYRTYFGHPMGELAEQLGCDRDELMRLNGWTDAAMYVPAGTTLRLPDRPGVRALANEYRANQGDPPLPAADGLATPSVAYTTRYAHPVWELAEQLDCDQAALMSLNGWTDPGRVIPGGTAIRVPDTPEARAKMASYQGLPSAASTPSTGPVTADPNSYFMTQTYDVRFNPNGSPRSSNCGPTSLAMALKAFGLKPPGSAGYGDTQRFIREVRVAMTGAYRPGEGTNSRQVIEGARRSGAAAEHVYGPDGVERALSEGKLVVAAGNPVAYNGRFDDIYRYNGAHFVLVTGVVGQGADKRFLVSDPLSHRGSIAITLKELARYMAHQNQVGVAIWPA